MSDGPVRRREDLIGPGGDRYYYVTGDGRLCCPWCGEILGRWGERDAKGDYLTESGEARDYPTRAMGDYELTYHRQCYREKVGEARAEDNRELGEFA